MIYNKDMEKKDYWRLEKITKGLANHRRVEILHTLSIQPSLSVLDLSQKLGVNFKTISEHLRRLNISGLVYKNSDGNSIRHTLSPRGKTILKFLRTLE